MMRLSTLLMRDVVGGGGLATVSSSGSPRMSASGVGVGGVTIGRSIADSACRYTVLSRGGRAIGALDLPRSDLGSTGGKGSLLRSLRFHGSCFGSGLPSTNASTLVETSSRPFSSSSAPSTERRSASASESSRAKKREKWARELRVLTRIPWAASSIWAVRRTSKSSGSSSSSEDRRPSHSAATRSTATPQRPTPLAALSVRDELDSPPKSLPHASLSCASFVAVLGSRLPPSGPTAYAPSASASYAGGRLNRFGAYSGNVAADETESRVAWIAVRFL